MQTPDATQSGAALVSVLVPVYRHARYVEACLDSIIASTYQELEIIVVNDASPDHSDDVIRQWLGRHPGVRLHHTRHELNMGVTKTLNEMIGRSQGAFICLVAGDDLLLPEGIAQRVRYLQAHPERLAVFGDCRVIDQDGSVVYESAIEGLYARKGMRKRYLLHPALLASEIVFHWAVPGPGLLCRRETFALVGLYDEWLNVEDRDMYLRLVARGCLGFIDAYVASYRIHDSNMVVIQREEVINSVVVTHWKHIPLFRGLKRLRLIAVFLLWQYRISTKPGRKLLLALLMLPSLLVSYSLHFLRRSLVLRWYRARTALATFQR